jgi:predicted Fe-S protein YdhL (DUF1289 family)
VYALMVYRHEDTVEEASLPLAAMAAWLAWYDTTPDTPCIAICSTSQGDDLCKGCGRTFDEVQHWPAMSPAAKRQVWRRITLEHGLALHPLCRAGGRRRVQTACGVARSVPSGAVRGRPNRYGGPYAAA